MHPTRLSIIIISLLTQCGKGIKQSQFPRETDDSELNFQPCKGKPNTHAWSTDESLPSNRLLLIPVHGSGPLSPTTGNHHIPTPMVLCNINKILSLRESGRYVHLPDLISYKAYRVPYLRHVSSTFKRLTTATTHCGLSDLSTQTDFNHEACNQIRPWSL